MDYSKLSDFEINKLVAEATGTKVEETYQFVNGGEDISDHMSGIVLMRKITSNRKHWKLYDPCNNPADAWPIIVENLIALRPVALHVGGHRWFATKGEGDFGMKYADDNPLRAAMVVFLMMQEQEND
ncbi:phage protein NinX family protein [Cronobacter sakazakii]